MHEPLTGLFKLFPEDSFMVGGIVRDALLGRISADIDIVIPGSAREVRKTGNKIASVFKAAFFPLDKETGVYRLILPGTRLQMDISPVQDGHIENDLKKRDFTANALAYPLSERFNLAISDTGVKLNNIRPEKIIDPSGGLRDISEQVIKCLSPAVLREDPLRLLRAFRCAAELGWSIDKKTLKHITAAGHLISCHAIQATNGSC